MPKSVEEVRFMMDCERLKVPPSERGGFKNWALRSGVGLVGFEFASDSGGVGLERLTPNGRRGIGRMRGGPSCAIAN